MATIDRRASWPRFAAAAPSRLTLEDLHYELRSAVGRRFPRGWRGAHDLDYGAVGNPRAEALAFTPLVAVNEGASDPLLGWEVLRIGSLLVPLPDYWTLRLEGPLDEVGSAPVTARKTTGSHPA